MLISVVIPVYGAPTILPVLYERLVAALSPWTDFELIMVNDCCPQGSGRVVAELAAKDSRVKFIDFMRNYGQHTAITAGLDHASGDYAVVMDCDLQDQPEEIKKMYDHLVKNDYSAVFGVRVNRQHNKMRQLESKAFGLFYGLLSQGTIKTTEDIGNFSVITAEVVKAFCSFRENGRLYGAILGRILPRIGYVEVAHSQRYEGETSYTMAKKLRLALNTIVSNSTKPLILAIYFAVGAFVLASVMGLKVLISYFFHGIAISGWASLMVGLCFFSGLQMLFLGILGSYVGNISTAVKNRPMYIISKTENLESGEKSSS